MLSKTCLWWSDYKIIFSYLCWDFSSLSPKGLPWAISISHQIHPNRICIALFYYTHMQRDRRSSIYFLAKWAPSTVMMIMMRITLPPWFLASVAEEVGLPVGAADDERRLLSPSKFVTFGPYSPPSVRHSYTPSEVFTGRIESGQVFTHSESSRKRPWAAQDTYPSGDAHASPLSWRIDADGSKINPSEQFADCPIPTTPVACVSTL